MKIKYAIVNGIGVWANEGLSYNDMITQTKSAITKCIQKNNNDLYQVTNVNIFEDETTVVLKDRTTYKLVNGEVVGYAEGQLPLECSIVMYRDNNDISVEIWKNELQNVEKSQQYINNVMDLIKHTITDLHIQRIVINMDGHIVLYCDDNVIVEVCVRENVVSSIRQYKLVTEIINDGRL